MEREKAQEIAALLSAFLSERMGPYLRLCEQNFAEALRLYDWNLQISGAFHQPIGIVEIVVRNSLASQLAKRHGSRPGTWLDDPDGAFSEMAASHIRAARRRVHKTNRGERLSRIDGRRVI
ncbi:hypothetical protein [Mycetocola saprophilus]|uniref:hypothetical protein n=1 Tax=Mycetocola saprophilus TaxID=76636 RepID=UPI003BF19BC8